MFSSSIWELESFYAPKDVIIAGGGMTGLWSAYYLKKFNPALKIVILEKSILPIGASTRNAGFACFGSVTELMADARLLGKEEMLKLVAMRYQGIKKIKNIFAPEEIDYEQSGGYELMTSKQYKNKKLLQKDIDWLNHCLYKVIHQKNVFNLADKKIRNFNFQQTDHLVENKLEAQLHPGKLMMALLEKVQRMGVMMLPGVELTSYETAGSKTIVQTNRSFSINTSQLLICTNANASQLLPGIIVTPARGQVLVTSPIKGLAFSGTFHYDEGFYYFRNLGNRVLLGGARNKAFQDEQTTDLNVSDNIQQELERFLREVVLPRHHFTIEHRWSGTMGMGINKLPSVMQVQPNCFCAVAMGGMGVALAPVAGRQVAKMMHTGNR